MRKIVIAMKAAKSQMIFSFTSNLLKMIGKIVSATQVIYYKYYSPALEP